MASGKYKVVGNHRVDGVKPGGNVELDDDHVDIDALVVGGHIQPVPAPAKSKSSKPEPKTKKGDA